MCLQNNICLVEAINMKKPHTDENNIKVFNTLGFIKPNLSPLLPKISLSVPNLFFSL